MMFACDCSEAIAIELLIAADSNLELAIEYFQQEKK
jgi:hypothetical protein